MEVPSVEGGAAPIHGRAIGALFGGGADGQDRSVVMIKDIKIRVGDLVVWTNTSAACACGRHYQLGRKTLAGIARADQFPPEFGTRDYLILADREGALDLISSAEVDGKLEQSGGLYSVRSNSAALVGDVLLSKVVPLLRTKGRARRETIRKFSAFEPIGPGEAMAATLAGAARAVGLRRGGALTLAALSPGDRRGYMTGLAAGVDLASQVGRRRARKWIGRRWREHVVDDRQARGGVGRHWRAILREVGRA